MTFCQQPRTVPGLLHGIRLGRIHFFETAALEFNGNFWRDFAIRQSRALVERYEHQDQVDAWENEGGA